MLNFFKISILGRYLGDSGSNLYNRLSLFEIAYFGLGVLRWLLKVLFVIFFNTLDLVFGSRFNVGLCILFV